MIASEISQYLVLKLSVKFRNLAASIARQEKNQNISPARLLLIRTHVKNDIHRLIQQLGLILAISSGRRPGHVLENCLVRRFDTKFLRGIFEGWNHVSVHC